MRNPHFDDGILIWNDALSGRYDPPESGYAEQFDLQWKLYSDGHFQRSVDASTDESAIADRIYELTHQHPNGSQSYLPSNGSRPLDVPLDVSLIRDKRCIDVGCGLGRWTSTMLALGAKSVLSVDMSASGLAGLKKFNDQTLRANLMELTLEHPELVDEFDFAMCWGVVMFTHDPLRAFLNAAATVKPGGAFYLEVYAPEGMHGTAVVNLRRKHFAQLQTVEEKFAYLDIVHDRHWDSNLPLTENLKNQLRNFLRRPQGSRIGTLDMLLPFYNWVIPLDVIQIWMRKAGFTRVQLLNEFDTKKCGYHVLGIKGPDSATSGSGS